MCISIHRSIFTGSLRISGIFLARCVGVNKKEMKHEVFDKAFEVLTKKSIVAINDFQDPGLGMVRYVTSFNS